METVSLPQKRTFRPSEHARDLTNGRIPTWPENPNLLCGASLSAKEHRTNRLGGRIFAGYRPFWLFGDPAVGPRVAPTHACQFPGPEPNLSMPRQIAGRSQLPVPAGCVMRAIIRASSKRTLANRPSGDPVDGRTETSLPPARTAPFHAIADRPQGFTPVLRSGQLEWKSHGGVATVRRDYPEGTVFPDRLSVYREDQLV
jgi:hypothetical protein